MGKLACKGVKAAADKASAVKDAAKGAAAVAKDVADKGPVGAAASAAGDQVMAGVTAWVAATATWFGKRVVQAIDKTTDPTLDAGWFRDYFGRMAQLAGLVAVLMIAAVVIQAVVRQHWALLGRSMVLYMPLAFLLTGAAVLVTQSLLVATDEMSNWVSQGVGEDAGDFLADATRVYAKFTAATAGGMGIPSFAVFIAAFVTVIGAVVVWLELVLREASIYVVVFFMPLFLVAMIWPRGQAIARRRIEILVALILSKFVLVAILTLAAAGLGNSRSEDAFAGALAGAALLVLAAFSPWVLFRLIPLVEHGASAAAAQRGGLRPGMSVATSPARMMGRQLDRMWRAGGGAGGGAGALAGGGAGAAVAAPLAAVGAAAGGTQRANDGLRNRADAQTSTASARPGTEGASGASSGASSTSSSSDGPVRPPPGGQSAGSVRRPRPPAVPRGRLLRFRGRPACRRPVRRLRVRGPAAALPTYRGPPTAATPAHRLAHLRTGHRRPVGPLAPHARHEGSKWPTTRRPATSSARSSTAA